jgi:hypothetical protein
MEEKPAATAVLGNAIVEWLADEALQNSEPANLYGELCQRLRGVGIPILRGQVAFRILHPLYDASTLDWNTQRGVVVEHFRPEHRVATISSCIAPWAISWLTDCQCYGAD